MDTMASPASLSFEPIQTTVSPDKTFDVSLNISTGTQPIISTDVWIEYDPTLIQPVLPAKSNGIFETTEAKIVAPGKLYLYGIHRDPMTAGPANTTVATLTFKPLKEGIAKLTFECPAVGSARSQIIKNDASLSNIINCERTAGHASTIAIGNPQVLGITDNMGSGALSMWYLTAAVAVLTVTTLLYIRAKNVAKEESHTSV